MNRSTPTPIRPACLVGLLALCIVALNSPSSARADATNPAEAPVPHGFSTQSTSGTKGPRVSGAFAPESPTAQAERKAARDRDARKKKDDK